MRHHLFSCAIRRFPAVAFLFPIFSTLYGQMHHPIFPNLSGQQLEQAVVAAYKPLTVLNYSKARDTLFKHVYLENDSVVCIYSQHKVYLPPNVDPTQAVYLDGAPNGINTEHSYPQSKGASEVNGNPYSDMHHLYPTRYAVNEARADFPFKEIPDNQTTKWFYRDQTLTTAPPLAVRDLYSESVSGGFEPRENQKGNIARAVFYFYTMYRPQALAADPLFFEAQRNTLCGWHDADPVDQQEYARTFIISRYQDNKPNPFVLDCSLAKRLYCTASTINCPSLPIVDIDPEAEIRPLFAVTPVPSTGTFRLAWYAPALQRTRILVWDAAGQHQETAYEGALLTGESIPLTTRLKGVLIVAVYGDDALIGWQRVVVTQ